MVFASTSTTSESAKQHVSHFVYSHANTTQTNAVSLSKLYWRERENLFAKKVNLMDVDVRLLLILKRIEN